jgi:ketosteroid isomerase-like protein
MASANVELAGRVIEAFNARDPVAFEALVTDDFEWVTPTAAGETKTYRGRDGVGQFFEDAKMWETLESHVDEIRDLGDGALISGELFWRNQLRGTIEVGGPFSSVLRFEGTRVKRIDTFRSTSDALGAAGLEP